MVFNQLGDDEQASRRRFLMRSAASMTAFKSLSTGSALAGLLTSVVSRPAVAASSGELPGIVPAPLSETGLHPTDRRRLHLVNAHTWDNLDVVYFTHGMYIDESIEQLDHLMRDRRANIARPIDRALYDQLLVLQTVLGNGEPVHVLSGYRTPETNARLRKRSNRVAKNSLHMEGRAADIYIPGVPCNTLHEAAMEMRAGGVGLYSKSNFIHLDTGPVRHWGQ